MISSGCISINKNDNQSNATIGNNTYITNQTFQTNQTTSTEKDSTIKYYESKIDRIILKMDYNGNIEPDIIVTYEKGEYDLPRKYYKFTINNYGSIENIIIDVNKTFKIENKYYKLTHNTTKFVIAISKRFNYVRVPEGFNAIYSDNQVIIVGKGVFVGSDSTIGFTNNITTIYLTIGDYKIPSNLNILIHSHLEHPKQINVEYILKTTSFGPEGYEIFSIDETSHLDENTIELELSYTTKYYVFSTYDQKVVAIFKKTDLEKNNNIFISTSKKVYVDKNSNETLIIIEKINNFIIPLELPVNKVINEATKIMYVNTTIQINTTAHITANVIINNGVAQPNYYLAINMSKVIIELQSKINNNVNGNVKEIKFDDKIISEEEMMNYVGNKDFLLLPINKSDNTHTLSFIYDNGLELRVTITPITSDFEKINNITSRIINSFTNRTIDLSGLNYQFKIIKIYDENGIEYSESKNLDKFPLMKYIIYTTISLTGIYGENYYLKFYNIPYKCYNLSIEQILNIIDNEKPMTKVNNSGYYILYDTNNELYAIVHINKDAPLYVMSFFGGVLETRINRATLYPTSLTYGFPDSKVILYPSKENNLLIINTIYEDGTLINFFIKNIEPIIHYTNDKILYEITINDNKTYALVKHNNAIDDDIIELTRNLTRTNPHLSFAYEFYKLYNINYIMEYTIHQFYSRPINVDNINQTSYDKIYKISLNATISTNETSSLLVISFDNPKNKYIVLPYITNDENFIVVNNKTIDITGATRIYTKLPFTVYKVDNNTVTIDISNLGNTILWLTSIIYAPNDDLYNEENLALTLKDILR